MAALEIVSGFATQPNTGLALTLSNGTLTIRNFSQGNAWLLQAWKNGQAAVGTVSIRSPRLHDSTFGIYLENDFVIGSKCQPLLPFGFAQRLIPQDTLTVIDTGSNVALDQEHVCMLVYYDSLDSSNGVFCDLSELEKRMVNVFGTIHSIAGAVTGQWSAGQAINAGLSGDLFKANTWYALLGFGQATETAPGNGSAVGLRGADTGNLMIGAPIMGLDSGPITPDWFLNLTKKFGRPMIPCINSANKGGTLVYVLNNENANTICVNPIWAELK